MTKLIIIFSLILFIAGCSSNSSVVSLDDPLESGREFIDASLKGNYDKAEKYIITDSVNIKYLESLREYYKKMPAAEKEGLKTANIIINPSENVTDSTTIINYSNTYKNKPSKIKMVKRNNQWKVDFKYTFTGDN